MKKKFLAVLLTLCMALTLLPPPAYAYSMGKVGQATTISTGDYYSAAIDTNGSLWTWGRNDCGQLGDGTTDDSIVPLKVMDGIVSVSCGNSHTAVIKTDGSLWTWGYNSDGQLGNGNTNNSSTPTKVLDDIVAVSCGGKHTAAIKNDGSLWVFGSSTHNSVSTSQKTTPTKVMDDVIAVSAGNGFTAVIKADNSLWTWGSNTDGQLGHNGGSPSRYPTQVMEDVIAVSAGTSHCTAIKSDGSLWAWGSYMYGKLGTEDSETTPAINSGVTSISAGCYHTAAIKSDGSLWMWGNNKYGQLGNGGGGSDIYQPPFSPGESEYFQRTPERILDNMNSVSAGSVHTIALASDGTIWVCGDNDYGQLGTGNTTASSIPVQIQLQQEPDVPPVPGDGGILALSPANGATNVGYDASNPPVFKITFDREIASSADQEFVADVDLTLEDTFAIYRKSDNALIYKPGADSHLRFTLTSYKKTLVVTPLNNHSLLNPATAYYVTMGEGLVKFVDGSTSPAINQGEWEFTTEIFEKVGTFTFPGSSGKNIEYGYKYSDAYFYGYGGTYKHNLATMSLNLALSAFNALEAPQERYKEDVAANNARNLLSDLCFENIDTSSYEGKPTDSSVAVAIGQKELTENGDTYTLIAVAVRGGGYEMEWASNFKVYSNAEHMGFSLAASDVSTNLLRYIQKNVVRDGKTPKIKLWIVGYSRGAAIANLVGAKYMDYAASDELYPGISLEKKDIYTYTFATPMATTSLDRHEYTNIFNVVNPIDVVPKVTPSVWKFGRYGKTLYIPAYEYDSDYQSYVLDVVDECNKICGSNYIRQVFPSQGAVLDDVINWTEKLGGADSTLSVTIQTQLVENQIKKYSDVQSSETVSKILELRSILSTLDDVLSGNPIGLAWSALLDSIKYVGKNTVEESADIIEMAHYPEVYLSWMNTIDLSSQFENGKYRKIYVECPVDIFIYNSSNQLVAQIINDEPQAANAAGIGVYIDGNGRKTIVASTDEEYHITLIATDDGTVTYTATEYDIDTCTTNRFVSYQNVKIESGDSLRGLVENLEDTSKANYPLYQENETTPLKPDVNNEGDGNNQPDGPTQPSIPTTPNYDGGSSHSSPTYSITIPSRVTGGTVKAVPTSASEGQRVTLTVTPDSGYELSKLIVTDGKGNELKLTAKDDRTYTFTMSNSKVDVDIDFVQQQTTPNFTDVQPDAYYADAVVWAVEKGITVGTSATTFSPDTPCTRAQIVTFLWRAAGSPSMGGNNPFTDVTLGSYYYDAVQWAVAQGITVGTSATTFSPDETCTRGQTVTFLYRYEKSPVVSGGNPFTDVSVDSYYTNAVQWAVNNGVTSGTSETTFSPNTTCTRGQIVTFLYRDIA